MLKTEKLGRTKELILTAGPSITPKEIEYINDAALNGWNNHHSDYIKKFERTFADYVGAKYAITTSSCTGALHLSMLALGIGPGDEVIVPEITWIATVSAIKYVGATPVFVDIEPDTWVMNPENVKKAITSRTKAIVPVHLYGHPVDMDPIIELANKHGLKILEDAAQSVGTEYKGKRTGSLGDIATFSFQGAKALVTGEGGMLVTNSKELIERAWFYNDHGRDPNKALYNLEIGYKYKMSNLQAALGLAQIERADEIVNRKRQIFNWYKERLNDIEEISLNVEKPWAHNIYWMSSLILGDSIKMSREEFMGKLKERNVDTRPFFYPISAFPMFKDIKVNNPISYKIPLRGINLPSGHNRTEEEVDYICAHVRQILGHDSSKVSASQPYGWLDFRDKTVEKIREYKELTDSKANDNTIELLSENKIKGALRPLTISSISDNPLIEKLSRWRDKAQNNFPSQFKVTTEGTKNWLENQVINSDNRILFMVEDCLSQQVGHVGLFRFDYQQRFCELDNIVRGENIEAGIMTGACKSLMKWAFNELGIEKLYLRVLSDNDKALNLYNRLGFKECLRTPLMKVEENDSVRWIDLIGQPYFDVEKYFITMQITKHDFIASNKS